MAGTRRAVLLDAFRSNAQAGFSFLVDRYGFSGPEVELSAVYYHSSLVSLDVTFDDRENYVQTYVRAQVGEKTVRAELSCLFVACGLGPAQRVGWSANTTHAIEKSLGEQCEAARLLLPRLLGPERDSLLLECHGR